MPKFEPSFNKPQTAFLELPHKFRGFVGGYGSGKTWVGSSALCEHAWEWPGINAGYFAPTYAHIRDIFYPTIEEVAPTYGLRVDIAESNKEVHLYYGKRYRCTIICRSMEKPSSIVGFKIGRALVDEIDVIKKDKAALAWRKIIARLRQKRDGLINGVDVTTTPEGFQFVYSQFVKAVRDKPSLAKMYGIVHASTYDNEENLPDDYIESLRESYPPQLIEAYLHGKFVNLTSGSVYPEFDREKNHTSARIEPGEALHVGMDFNVLNMHAVISVIRGGKPLTLAEAVRIRDTPTMVRHLKERFPGHEITVYPDASGKNTSSKLASQSDLTILREGGFTIRVNDKNPAVKDRISSMNALILNDAGVRTWLVNTDECPTLTEAVEQQAYADNGEPDKQSGFDHATEAAGYFLSQRWPIVKRVAVVKPLRH
jgi:hypothetical protein